MISYEISFEARNDLAEVWLFIAEQSGDEIADHFIDNLGLVCDKISKMPNMGSSQDHIWAHVKSYGE